MIVMMVMLEKEGQEVKKMINNDDGDQCSGEEEGNGHRTVKEKNEMYGPLLFIFIINKIIILIEKKYLTLY